MSHKWLKSQVRELISLWECNYKRLNRSRRNRPVYDEIASRLNNKFNLTLDGSEVNLKIKNLKNQYKLEGKKQLSGSSSICWWAYDLVHKIIISEPVDDFFLVSDSMAESLQELNGSVNVAAREENFETAGPSGVGNVPDTKFNEDSNEQIDKQPPIDPRIPHLNSSPCIDNEDEKNRHKKRILDLTGDDDEKNSKNKIRKVTAIKSKFKIPSSIRAILRYLNDDGILGEKEIAMREREIALREREIAIRQTNDDKFNKFIDFVDTYVQNQMNNKVPSDAELTFFLGMMACLKMILSEESRQDYVTKRKNLCKSVLPLLSMLETEEKSRIWSKPKSNTWFKDIYPTLTDEDFKEHFRVCRKTLMYLVSQLRPYMEKKCTNMRDSIPLEKRIAVGLHYLASSKEYSVVSSLFGIGKSTANDIVHSFVTAINTELLPKCIKFPNKKENLKLASNAFEALLGFPQCIGTIGCCHFPVNPPNKVAAYYRNYNGWNSTVLLAVTDALHRFIYVNVGSPGKNNASHILNNSSMGKILNSNIFDQDCKNISGVSVPVCLIGDSAFPLKRNLLKSYPEHLPLTEAQKHYNRVCYGATKVIENTFWRLKARFRILQNKMDTDIRFAPEIIKACCVLHNVCEYLNDECQSDWIDHNPTEAVARTQNVSIAGNNGPGNEVRDAIASHLFGNKK